MRCVDTIATYLFYIFIIDFSLEMLDLIHRIYEADESFRSLNFMAHTKLFFSQIVLQSSLCTLVSIALLLTQVVKLPAICANVSMSSAGCLTMIGIFAMRWNVVIGGQLFSKSFLGYTTYKMAWSRGGLLMAVALNSASPVAPLGAGEAVAALAREARHVNCRQLKLVSQDDTTNKK